MLLDLLRRYSWQLDRLPAGTVVRGTTTTITGSGLRVYEDFSVFSSTFTPQKNLNQTHNYISYQFCLLEMYISECRLGEASWNEAGKVSSYQGLMLSGRLRKNLRPGIIRFEEQYND